MRRHWQQHSHDGQDHTQHPFENGGRGGLSLGYEYGFGSSDAEDEGDVQQAVPCERHNQNGRGLQRVFVHPVGSSVSAK